MTPEEIAGYALAKAGAWPDSPWENDQVAKVGPGERGKIFAFLGTDSVGVKCGPGRDGAADEWIDRYPGDATVMAYIGRSGLEHPAPDRSDPRRTSCARRWTCPTSWWWPSCPGSMRPEGGPR